MHLATAICLRPTPRPVYLQRPGTASKHISAADSNVYVPSTAVSWRFRPVTGRVAADVSKDHSVFTKDTSWYSSGLLFLDWLTLKMKTPRSLETPGSTHRVTRRHMPEECLSQDFCHRKARSIDWRYSSLPGRISVRTSYFPTEPSFQGFTSVTLVRRQVSKPSCEEVMTSTWQQYWICPIKHNFRGPITLLWRWDWNSNYSPGR